MKVVLLNTLYYPQVVGGAERVVQLLAEALVGAGHQAVVVALDGGDASRGVEGGVDVLRLPLRNVYWPFHGATDRHSVGAASKAVWHVFDSYNPLMAHTVGRLLDAEKPDVVHSHNLVGF